MVLLASASAPAGGQTVEQQEKATADPHWKADRCTMCHVEDGASPRKIPTDVSTRLCLNCHDGNHAKAESHPILRGFKGKNVSPPDGWPLLKGLITCTTCHTMTSHCQPEPVKPKTNAQFLREYQEGRLLAFCSKCHEQTQYTPFNPHDQIEPEGGVRDQSCQFCHEPSILQSREGRRTGAARLYVDSAKVCQNCHLEHWDFFDPGHLGQVPDADMRERMLIQELVGKLDLNDDQLRRYARSIRRGPERLPLDEKNRIACFTCHNPHQAGVFPRGSELAIGELSFAGDDRGPRPPVRSDGRGLCINCHDK